MHEKQFIYWAAVVTNTFCRKTSTYDNSSTQRPKVKERSSSLSLAGRGNISHGQNRRNGDMNGETNREALRQLLCDLRKDAMDDDLENNDGTFFPCEFCGDPYPVEYLMRHQVRNNWYIGIIKREKLWQHVIHNIYHYD